MLVVTKRGRGIPRIVTFFFNTLGITQWEQMTVEEDQRFCSVNKKNQVFKINLKSHLMEKLLYCSIGHVLGYLFAA